MNDTIINIEISEKSTQSESLVDRTIVDDAVDMSVLSSLEEVHADGEPDLVVELIDLYLVDVTQKLKTMREALTSNDRHSLHDLAHSLKGSSSILGARSMAARCDDLELSAGDASSQENNASLTRVEHEFERARHAFAAERQKRSTVKSE